MGLLVNLTSQLKPWSCLVAEGYILILHEGPAAVLWKQRHGFIDLLPQLELPFLIMLWFCPSSGEFVKTQEHYKRKQKGKKRGEQKEVGQGKVLQTGSKTVIIKGSKGKASKEERRDNSPEIHAFLWPLLEKKLFMILAKDGKADFI